MKGSAIYEGKSFEFFIMENTFNNSCYSEQLETFLHGLKINLDDQHVYFGSDLKKLINDTFVKQLYLKKTKSDSEYDLETKYILFKLWFSYV